MLSHVPAPSASETSEVAEDQKAIFKVRREKTVLALAEEFVELCGGVFRRRFRCSRPAWATLWPIYEGGMPACSISSRVLRCGEVSFVVQPPVFSCALINASPSLPSGTRDRNHILRTLAFLACVGKRKRKAEQRNRS